MPRIIKENFSAGQFFVFIKSSALASRLAEGSARPIWGMPFAYEAITPPPAVVKPVVVPSSETKP